MFLVFLTNLESSMLISTLKQSANQLTHSWFAEVVCL